MKNQHYIIFTIKSTVECADQKWKRLHLRTPQFWICQIIWKWTMKAFKLYASKLAMPNLFLDMVNPLCLRNTLLHQCLFTMVQYRWFESQTSSNQGDESQKYPISKVTTSRDVVAWSMALGSQSDHRLILVAVVAAQELGHCPLSHA